MDGASDVLIHLLRHGETEGGPRYCGRTDVALSTEGWRQMWSAVEGGGPWRAIVSSPLTRCADFAKALARRCDAPLRLDARLREIDFGEWENRAAVEIITSDAQRLTAFWEDPLRNTPPGGETLTAVQARVLAAWADIVAERRPTLVVTHGGPLRVIHCHCSQLPLERLLDIPAPHATLQRLRIPMKEHNA